MDNVKDILIQAKARITDPKHWTTGVFARDVDENKVTSNSDKAVCWCALGAIYATTKQKYELRAKAAQLMEQCADTNVPAINDYNGHAAVLALFDKAIAKCNA